MKYINRRDNITNDFYWWEFFKVPKGSPLQEVILKSQEPYINNVYLLCKYLLQPLRTHIKNRMVVLRGFSTFDENIAVGGVPTSLHLDGLAADITTDKKHHLFMIYAHAKDNLKEYISELILYTDEHGNPISIHIAFVKYKYDGNERLIKKMVHPIRINKGP
jgi:hypothetical protein